MLPNVTVKLRETLVWFDSRISLLQKNFKSNVGPETFEAVCMPVRNPAHKKYQKISKTQNQYWKIARKLVTPIINLGWYFYWNFICILAEKVINVLREAHLIVNPKFAIAEYRLNMIFG